MTIQLKRESDESECCYQHSGIKITLERNEIDMKLLREDIRDFSKTVRNWIISLSGSVLVAIFVVILDHVVKK